MPAVKRLGRHVQVDRIQVRLRTSGKDFTTSCTHHSIEHVGHDLPLLCDQACIISHAVSQCFTNFKCNIKGSPAPGGVAGTWLSKYSIDALTGTSARQGGDMEVDKGSCAWRLLHVMEQSGIEKVATTRILVGPRHDLMHK